MQAIPAFGPADLAAKERAQRRYAHTLPLVPPSLRPAVEAYVQVLERSVLAEYEWWCRIHERELASPPVTSRLLDDETAYIDVANIRHGAAPKLREALRRALDAGARRFVVDLRDCAGGPADEAALVGSEFVASGPILHTPSRAWNASGAGCLTDPRYDLRVLTNRWTASSAEALAAAVQESGRGLIVGERTFGKSYLWSRNPDTHAGTWTTRAGATVDATGYAPSIHVADERASGSDPILARAVSSFDD